jgi:hypothetical protein
MESRYTEWTSYRRKRVNPCGIYLTCSCLSCSAPFIPSQLRAFRQRRKQNLGVLMAILRTQEILAIIVYYICLSYHGNGCGSHIPSHAHGVIFVPYTGCSVQMKRYNVQCGIHGGWLEPWNVRSLLPADSSCLWRLVTNSLVSCGLLGPALGESLDAKSSAHGLDEISPALESASSIIDTHKTWEDPSCSSLDLESGCVMTQSMGHLAHSNFHFRSRCVGDAVFHAKNRTRRNRQSLSRQAFPASNRGRS